MVGILLAAGAAYFVLLPILRPPLAGSGDADADAVDEGEDPEDDMTPQAVALRALKEIEFDRATGKLSDADYEQLKAKYTHEALVAMRAESGAGSREPGVGSQEPEVGSPVSPIKPAPVSRLPTPSCPDHGARPEKNAQFCSTCGRRLGTAPGYCVRCGTPLETDARYCNRCGARVAA